MKGLSKFKQISFIELCQLKNSGKYVMLLQRMVNLSSQCWSLEAIFRLSSRSPPTFLHVRVIHHVRYFQADSYKGSVRNDQQLTSTNWFCVPIHLNVTCTCREVDKTRYQKIAFEICLHCWLALQYYQKLQFSKCTRRFLRKFKI